jgi:hypothetical protein
MGLLMNAFKAFYGVVGIYLCRSKAGMAQQFLDCVYIGTFV